MAILNPNHNQITTNELNCFLKLVTTLNTVIAVWVVYNHWNTGLTYFWFLHIFGWFN